MIDFKPRSMPIVALAVGRSSRRGFLVREGEYVNESDSGRSG